MSPSQRCDEILRLIDETLSDHPTPCLIGSAAGITGSADTWKEHPAPIAEKGRRSRC